MGNLGSSHDAAHTLACDCDLSVAIVSSKQLETLLESRLSASGKGLQEKISSVEPQLPDSLRRKLRRVATIRNKVVHEVDFNAIPDRARFMKDVRECQAELKALAKQLHPDNNNNTDAADNNSSFCAIT